MYYYNKMSCIKLLPEDSRLTTLPIARPGLWELYKQATRCFWVADQIPLSQDRQHYEERLTPGQKHFVDLILAFFATSDKLVNINLAARFKQEVPILEAEAFYDFQMAMENIHAEIYAQQLNTIIADPQHRQKLLDGIHTIPVIRKMADWMTKCTQSDEPFPVRLLRMACVEGIFFISCFCAIYWLKKKDLMPGLGLANEFIARDESLHTRFALHVFDELIEQEHKPSSAVINGIVSDAVDIAKEFVNEALKTDLPEMNAKLMKQYVECAADGFLSMIHMPALYKSENPFDFMIQQGLGTKTNFFERRESNYSMPSKSDSSEWNYNVEF